MTESTIEALKQFVEEVTASINSLTERKSVNDAANELIASLNHEPPISMSKSAPEKKCMCIAHGHLIGQDPICPKHGLSNQRP